MSADLKTPQECIDADSYLCFFLRPFGGLVVEIKLGSMLKPWRGDASLLKESRYSAGWTGQLGGEDAHYTIHLTDGSAIYMRGVSIARGQNIQGLIEGVSWMWCDKTTRNPNASGTTYWLFGPEIFGGAR